MNKFSLYVVCLGFFVSCAGISHRSEYKQSIRAWKEGNLQQGREELPRTEKKGFIATLEKAHMDFILGSNDYKELEAIAEKSKNRLRFSASTSLKSFFYLETEEGYYASEAEIIYMHILLGMYYVRAEKYDSGKVQARYAGNLLSGEWSAEGQFDDPTLRLLLAGLWISTGEWEEAKVDLRKASLLKPNSSYIKYLLNQTAPPKEFFLIMGGPGAEPVMNPQVNLNLIRGLRNLDFVMTGKESKIYLTSSSEKNIDLHLEKNTKNWYDRHIIRDNAMSEVIEDSKYFQRLTGTAVVEGTKGTAKIGFAFLAGAAIAAVGGGVAYLGMEANSSELFALGVGIIVVGLQTGGKIADEAIRDAEKNVKRDLDVSGNYRYVRFMPEYIWIGMSPKKEIINPELIISNEKSAKILTSPQGKIKTRYGFVPDIP